MIPQHAQDEIMIFGKRYTRGEFLPFYVPREYMPQVAPDHLAEVIHRSFGEHHSAPQLVTVAPHLLRFHQRISPKRVEMMPPWAKVQPILISSDYYVVDGNHRLWRHLRDNTPLILAVMLPLSFNGALDWLGTLPFVTHSKL